MPIMQSVESWTGMWREWATKSTTNPRKSQTDPAAELVMKPETYDELILVIGGWRVIDRKRQRTSFTARNQNRAKTVTRFRKNKP